MQQVLNSQERNQAFLKFLLFFLITVVLIVTAIYFNYRLPLRENRMLQDRVNVQSVRDNNQQNFVNRMAEAVNLLDSLDKKGVDHIQINLLLDSKIGELSVLAQKDVDSYGKMNKVIVDKLDELQDKKKELREATSNSAKFTTIEAELKDCKDKSVILEGQLDAYRNRAQ